MVFLGKEIIVIVKNFWPHRSKVRGFSIENLARKYREKISKVSSNKIPDQLLEGDNLITQKDDISKKTRAPLALKIAHWANRDFSEYRDAA